MTAINSATTAIKKHLLPIALLTAAALILFRDLSSHSFLTNWDDALYVTANQAAQGFSAEHLRQAFSSFYAGNYAPLQIISYMLDYELWGKWAGGYKLVNLCIHTLTGLLLYVILYNYFAATRFAAFCAAAIFIIHPVQVESVAWISQRKTVMSGMFMLLSFLAYLEGGTHQATGRRQWYFWSVAAFTAALLTKTTTVVLLPLLILYDWLIVRRITWRDKLPYLVVTIIMVVTTLVSQSPENHGGISEYHGGSPLATLLTMLTVLPRYITMIFWPLQLSAVYNPLIHKALDPAVLAAAGSWLLMAAGGVWLVNRTPRLAFWYLSFFVGLLPVSQIVPIATIMNDRYLYLPLMGVAGCAAYLITRLDRLPSARLRAALIIVTPLPLIPLALETSRQVKVWRNSVALWTSATDRVDSAAEAWTGLANACQQDRKFAAALAAYLRAIILKPDNDIAINNVTLLYLSLGKTDKAAEYAARLIKINRSAVAYTTVAMVHFAREDYAEAANMLEHALAKDPKLETALTLMGSVATEQGRFDEARRFLNKSMELHGPIGPILFAMASLEGAIGKRDVSARLLIRALEAGYQDSRSLVENRHLAPVVQEPEMQQIINRFIPETFR